MTPVRSSRRIRKEPPDVPVPTVGLRKIERKGKESPTVTKANEPLPVIRKQIRRKEVRKSEDRVKTPAKEGDENSGNTSQILRKGRPALKDVDVDQLPGRALRKEKIVVARTSSFKDTFPGRLEWKKRHYDKPVTSTPVATKTKLTESIIAKDLSSCFGFDDSTDAEIEEYRSLPISPIVKQRDRVRVEQQGDRVVIKRIPQVLEVPPPPPPPQEPPLEEHHKAGFDELYEKYECSDEEIHFNREGTKRTYTHARTRVRLPTVVKKRRSKRERSTILKPQPEVSKKPRKGTARSKKKDKNEELNTEYEKLAEQMNKQFAEIAKVPLVVENSFEVPVVDAFDP